MTSKAEGPEDRIAPIGDMRSSAQSATSVLSVLVGVVLACSILLAAHNMLSLSFGFEKNYNEGWNVYNAERLIDHETVYDANYWRVNNYPVVSFLLVAGLDSVIHDRLLTGRIIALLAFLALGVLAALATMRFGGDRVEAIFAAGCALGFSYLVAPAWVAVDDPQTLAEAIMLAGLVSYLSAAPRGLGLLRTAFLVMLAGFTKHNVVAIPLAITVDIALRAPRRLPSWLASCIGFGALFLGLTQAIAGGAFLDHLLSPRVYLWYNVHYHLMKYLRLFKFPLAVIVLMAPAMVSRERLVLAAYGVLAIAGGALLSGLEGTSFNLFQDAAVFLAIAAGVALHELRRWVKTRWGSGQRLAKAAVASGLLVLAQPIITESPQALAQLYHAGRLFEVDRAAERSFLADAAYVAERGRPAICESLLLCYRAGQPFILDPFNARQYILAGRLDQSELIGRVAARDFAVIQLRSEICDDPATPTCHILHYPRKFDRFTDEFLYAVDRYYRIDRRSSLGVFYVPK
jgi:hypothetical protein